MITTNLKCMPEPTIKEIKKLIKRCPKNPDSSTWNIHKYVAYMELREHWISDLSDKDEICELISPLFDDENQYLGTEVLDKPKVGELFYELSSLLEDRPLTADETQWTEKQKNTVETLRLNWIWAYWEGLGTDKEWKILKSLFSEDGSKYLGG
ncbi:hypothetical protein Q5691_15355 [Microcoleus sp. w1-18aA5]|uniref:hypothetical protein n=1 Tax=Microcoleus sp. w1-18aA5 TaxID=2818982 RepID=UPI002FCE88B6